MNLNFIHRSIAISNGGSKSRDMSRGLVKFFLTILSKTVNALKKLTGNQVITF